MNMQIFRWTEFQLILILIKNFNFYPYKNHLFYYFFWNNNSAHLETYIHNLHIINFIFKMMSNFKSQILGNSCPHSLCWNNNEEKTQFYIAYYKHFL